MFRNVRLKEQAVGYEEAVGILKRGSYGVLSTVGEDGYPYGVPLNYTYVDRCICFHCALTGHKLDNLDVNAKVSFCVVTKSEVLGNEFDTDYESAIAFGKAVPVTDDSEKKAILLSLLNKYASYHLKAGTRYMKKFWDETRVIKMRIEHLTGKAHE